MIIKVEVKNDLLGDSEFWRGDSRDVSEIRNIPARELAEMVAKDGVSRNSGMWYVSEVKDG